MKHIPLVVLFGLFVLAGLALWVHAYRQTKANSPAFWQFIFFGNFLICLGFEWMAMWDCIPGGRIATNCLMIGSVVSSFVSVYMGYLDTRCKR